MNCKFIDMDNFRCRLSSRICNKENTDKCKLYQKVYYRDIIEQEVYDVRDDVVCCKCSHKGAIQSIGVWLPNGVSADVVESCSEIYGKNFDKPQMDYEVGFGGTIPWKCTNCGNTGLIDCEGLEGYHMAFKSIK